MKLEKEDEHFFHLRDDKSSFRVAKGGIGHTTHDQIKKHFADGGEAKGYSGEDGNPEEQLVPAETSPTSVAGYEAEQALVRDAERRGLFSPPEDKPAEFDYAANAQQFQDKPSPATAPPPMLAALDGQSAQPEQPKSQAADAAKDNAAASIPQLPQLPRLENRDPQIKRAFEDQRLGSDAYAQAKQDEGAALAAHYDGLIKKQADDVGKWQAQRAKLDQENEALRQNLMNPANQVSGEHFWANKDTGSKISAAIGMILGGIGAGMTGGPNQGLQVINAAIDRDMQAQKTNLDNKHTLLNFNMARTRNLDESFNISQAQQIAVVRSQIAKTAALSQGPEAKARAMMLDGQLAQQQEQLLNATGLQRHQANAQNLAVAQAAVQKSAGDSAIAKLMAGRGDQGDVATAHALGMGESIVQRHNGMWALAKGKDSRKEFDESGKSVDKVFGTLEQMNDLIAAAPIASKAPFGQAQARGKVLEASLMPMLNEAMGVKRLTHEDIENVLKPAIAEITSPTTSNATARAKMAQLIEQMHNIIGASEANYTFMQRQPRLKKL